MAQKKSKYKNSYVSPFLLIIGGIVLGAFIGYSYKSYLVGNEMVKRDTWPETTVVERFPEKKAQIVEGYAVIPEIGIKLFIGETLPDLTYVIESYRTERRNPYKIEISQIARFSTESLSRMSTGCTAKYSPIGAISKNSEKPTFEISITRLGEYYYSFAHPQATCSDDPVVQGRQSTQIGELGRAFQKIEISN